MKIRWTSNSIRLRITPTELAALMQNCIVFDSLRLGSGAWSARIVPGCAYTDYNLVDGSLQVNLSNYDRFRLSDESAEGVYFEPDSDPGVRLYIEKDFPCVHPRASESAEPQTEVFDPPAGFEERKSDGPTLP